MWGCWRKTGLAAFPSPKAFRRFLDQPRGKSISVRLLGRTFTAPDALSFYWSYHEIFGERIYEFAPSQEEFGILDLGANCGLASLFFLERFPRARVTAVEPDPGIFRMLEANTSAYPPERLTRVAAAVAATRDPQPFRPDGADSGRLVTGRESAAGDLLVAGRPLDDFLEAPVELLKMDVEGAETGILCASRGLSQARRIFVEYHGPSGKNQDLDRLLEKLSASGFRYFIHNQFCSPRPFLQTAENCGYDQQLNIFAIRSSAAP